MNKIRKTGVFLLLCLMTVCVVCLPAIVSEQSDENLQKETIAWHYEIRNRAEITGEQVARLYYSREINMGAFYPVSSDRETYDTPGIQAEIRTLFETLFENSAPVCENVTRILDRGSLRYSQSSSLTKIDNHPFALHFIEVSVNADDGAVSFTYEEKTKTVICVSYESASCAIDHGSEGEMLELAVKNYYEGLLGLDAGEYYFLNETEEKDGRKEYYTAFGMLQSPTDADGKD